VKIELYSPTIRRKEMDAVLTALVEEKIGPGEQQERLASVAKDALGFEYCIALRSPAVALFEALQMLGLEDGDGVVVSTLSPWYYKGALEALRLQPVYCDAEAGTAALHADGVRWAIEHATEPGRVKALVAYHALGLVPDMEALLAVGLPVIEDCSTAAYCAIGEKRAGSFGQLCVMGLEERDMLTGGGGALLYSADKRSASALRNRPELPPESRLPDMNAVMAVVQFREAKRNMERRAEIAAMYTQAALRTRHKLLVKTNDLVYNNYAFPLVLETGWKDTAAYARKKEIELDLAFSGTIVGRGLLDNAKYQESYSISLRTVLFPLYPRLSAKDVGRVAKLIQTLP
jgi:dTDP-4-amino-4,6-dideoxygalactose transaminase